MSQVRIGSRVEMGMDPSTHGFTTRQSDCWRHRVMDLRKSVGDCGIILTEANAGLCGEALLRDLHIEHYGVAPPHVSTSGATQTRVSHFLPN